MKGIILAAGYGTRLSGHQIALPKVLLPVAGRPIIDYTLEAFGQAGITELAIITGYKSDMLEEWIGDGSRLDVNIHYIFNPDYQLGNALSLNAARAFTKEDPFLLSMADHMISYGLLTRLMDIQEPTSALAVDYLPSSRNIEEGTKVLVTEEGLITNIGKSLDRWNGIDAGVFRLEADIFEAIDYVIDEDRSEYELSQAITRMMQQGNTLRACDISGSFWQDIDTWEDLVFVRDVLAGDDTWTYTKKE